MAISESFTVPVDTKEPDAQLRNMLQYGKKPFLIIFTDLDGTFLDHRTYSAAAARPELEALKLLRAPIICISSKTEIEMRRIREEEGITSPFVPENGSAVFWGDSDEKDPAIAGPGYKAINAIIDQLPENLRSKITTFEDMGIRGVMEATGLDEKKSRDASNRAATTPFSFSGTDEEFAEVRTQLAKHNLKCPKGGRFYSATPIEAGKEVAMTKIVDHYREKIGDQHQIITVALGDGENDKDMICSADIGVVIPTPEKAYMVDTSRARGLIIKADKPGPAGWSEVMRLIRTHLFPVTPEPHTAPHPEGP